MTSWWWDRRMICRGSMLLMEEFRPSDPGLRWWWIHGQGWQCSKGLSGAFRWKKSTETSPYFNGLVGWCNILFHPDEHYHLGTTSKSSLCSLRMRSESGTAKPNLQLTYFTYSIMLPHWHPMYIYIYIIYSYMAMYACGWHQRSKLLSWSLFPIQARGSPECHPGSKPPFRMFFFWSRGQKWWSKGGRWHAPATPIRLQTMSWMDMVIRCY